MHKNKMNHLKISNKFKGRDAVSLVSIDPGESSGVVECTLTRLSGDLWQPEINAQTLTWPDGAKDIKNIILRADIIIIEEFKVRAKEAKSIIGDRLFSAEVTGWVIGTIEASVDKQRVVVTQQPWAKEFCPPKVVQARLGFWPTLDKNGKAIESHEGDAILHLLYYLSK